MEQIAAILGFEAEERKREFAVIHCRGDCQKAPSKVKYSGLKSCRLANMVSVGESECPTGCLHFGDCVSVCKFGALTMNEKSGMPQVDINKCVGCRACVNICPRKLIELKSFDDNDNSEYSSYPVVLTSCFVKSTISSPRRSLIGSVTCPG